HAWSAARPTHESDKTADTLEKEVQLIREAEKGRTSHTTPDACMLTFSALEHTRQRLNDFITHIKIALAALTGL
ncbi:uncharacterized protein TRAVEDRAFT_94657, partial [Trametes versicolor FP-101664 SS1]|uniref:uncharacterized protein n=1 Tax=Trametes versicolor (strain FP-101664) TaxID=717944 RepID=UPI00046234B9